MSSAKAKELNAKMARVAPELSSSYAKYPLEREKWLTPKEKAPNGEPAFIKSNDVGVKQDYVYCKRGPGGPGYYHLLTQISYVNLYSRLSSEAPTGCSCSKSGRELADDYYDVRQVVHNRSVARIPSDSLGAETALKLAQGRADADYHATQNQQLVTAAVLTAASN